MLLLVLASFLSSSSVHSFSNPPFTSYQLERTCKGDKKQSLHLNTPAIFTYNSTVNKSFSCHLELHLHSKSLGFSAYIERLDIAAVPDCKQDFVQFGRDQLFITTYTSAKFCRRIEASEEVRDESGDLIRYNFGNVSYTQREYIEDEDNEMDVWLSLAPSRNVKTVKLVVSPFRKKCSYEDEKYYRRCPGSGRCFKKDFFCSGLVKCGVLPKSEYGLACQQETNTGDFFYLPIIIIVTVVIIIATVIIGFAIKMAIKHLQDNGVGSLEVGRSHSGSRTCSPATTNPVAALLTPEREQRRPDSQEIQLGPGGVAGGRDPAKQAAPPSYDEVVQLAGGGDEPPQYQDVVPETGQ